MGQNQPKESEGKRIEGIGGAERHENLKDRTGAKFQDKHANNPASGTGSKGNPGKPQ